MNDKFRLAFMVDTKRTQGSFYTATMGTGLRMAVVGLLCLHAARCQAGDTEQVMGPPFLVTDGTRDLNLTCPEAGASYVWFTPGSGEDEKRCEKDRVCVFQPRIEDDNGNVTCVVSNAAGKTVHRSTYTVNLKYPPQSKPNITRKRVPTNAFEHIITCTVSGGKPRVTHVTFHCQKPVLPDQTDNISKDNSSVSSPITVNVQQEEMVTVNCSCSAHWAPEPGLYLSTEDINLELSLDERNRQSRFIANRLGVTAVAFVVMSVI